MILFLSNKEGKIIGIETSEREKEREREREKERKGDKHRDRKRKKEEIGRHEEENETTVAYQKNDAPI